MSNSDNSSLQRMAQRMPDDNLLDLMWAVQRRGQKMAASCAECGRAKSNPGHKFGPNSHPFTAQPADYTASMEAAWNIYHAEAARRGLVSA